MVTKGMGQRVGIGFICKEYVLPKKREKLFRVLSID